MAQRAKKINSARVKAYMDAVKHESLLLGPVDRWVQTMPNDRDQTVIHPSEMAKTDWCHRATWHRLMGHTQTKKSSMTLRSALIFDTGHQVHGKWQNWLRQMGVLFGGWYCPSCESRSICWADELLVLGCHSKSGRHQWLYTEVSLGDPSRNIKGNADGIFNVTGDENLLLEIKSVGPGTMRALDILKDDMRDELSSSVFGKISRPMASHIRQVQIYVRLSENYKEQIGEVNRAVVVYEHKADQQAKEFVLTKSPRITDPLFEAAHDIAWAVANEREIQCPNGGCADCASYEVAE